MLKQTILNTITDLVSNLLYYDRRSDEDLPLGVIENAVKSGDITIDEMVDQFRAALQDKFR